MESKEFTEKKKLIELQSDSGDKKHEQKMLEIETEKQAKLEIEKIRHENSLGEIRFKRASIDYSKGLR